MAVGVHGKEAVPQAEGILQDTVMVHKICFVLDRNRLRFSVCFVKNPEFIGTFSKNNF
jgi:hypothetical protein